MFHQQIDFQNIHGFEEHAIKGLLRL